MKKKSFHQDNTDVLNCFVAIENCHELGYEYLLDLNHLFSNTIKGSNDRVIAKMDAHFEDWSYRIF